MKNPFWSIVVSFVAFIVAFIAVGCASRSPVEKDPPLPKSDTRVDSSTSDPVKSNTTFRDRMDKKPRVDVNPGATPAPPKFVAAAENSEASLSMNSDGSVLETRVFRNHEQLNKVEATWFNPKEKSLKFYLRGGKIVEVKTDKIASLQSALTSELLEVAGITGSRKTADRQRIVTEK